MRDSPSPSSDQIDPTAAAVLDVVVDLLASEGYEGVQLREVARRCHTSLSTIYKFFPSRHLLILAAVERWMAAAVYRELPSVAPGESMQEALDRFFAHIFAPWREHPSMYGAFIRARTGPDGERLQAQGAAATEGFFEQLLSTVPPEERGYVEEALSILAHVVMGVFTLTVTGEMDLDQMIEELQKAVCHLAVAPPPHGDVGTRRAVD